MGLRIVVDGVFNHTGREFFAFQDIQKNRESSRYCGWYKGVNFGWNSPYNDGFGYEAWRNCFELVNLNLQNREVKDYLFDVIRFWIHEFDIDGIRLDCADCLDFDFMKEMRWMTGNEKQDFWLMGEVIHGDYARCCLLYTSSLRAAMLERLLLWVSVRRIYPTRLMALQVMLY